ncbi:TniB family NTP-binding protein [Pseudomonas aeruginosa]|uniref:Putative TniB-like transposition protein n=1 Tax=Pseudomonas fluorescens TaxID=294 RepID=A0A448BLH2_PSEFL|nr:MULTISPECIES: TniB family NTP-binding protein [Pseudomonadaceae]VEE46146.1 putative TniB-like transposition protein [Pseudomonas fluorescens]WPD46505.1 TniB family NTP-binding protein [Pseudomonas aeruginosa]HBN9750535.1 TniB family NTP-binding protein [Pseudomonas aeruginosa]HBN9860442.1 TniB family NTP-binding protein [Pseudomonas aeruginosa]HBN9885806.1 TniB family NTP-binding protein [Pseudomonas aeruginosa]
MSSYEHLTASARELACLSGDMRLAAIQRDSFYIDHPQSDSILIMIENVLAVPRRMQAPCIIVTGAPGAGKSSIIQQIRSSEALSNQIAFLDMTANPFNLKFGELLVSALGLPHGLIKFGLPRKATLPAELAEVIKLRKIKALVIDELHDSLLVARPEQLKNLSILKALSNHIYGLSIIGFGIDLARNALSMDEQFSRRFYSVQVDDWSESESFRSFLAGVEQNLPLRRPSSLDGADVIGFLLENTGGRMDSIMNSIKSAACYAIKSGEERITIDSLAKAISRPWSY